MPEPFSPTSAWTSPARQSKLTFVSAANGAELAGHARQFEHQFVVHRRSRGIASVQPPNISASTLSGTSDVPETTSLTRFGVAVGVGDLPHHVRHHDLTRYLGTLEGEHRGGDSDPGLEVAAGRVPDVVRGLGALRPVAEQGLLVGAQCDGEVLDRDAELVVRLQRGVEPVGVLVGPALDLRVGREQAANRVERHRVHPVRVAGGRVLVGRRVDEIDAVRQSGRRALLPTEGQGVAGRTAEHADLAAADPCVEHVREAVAERTQVLADHGGVVLAGNERALLAGQADVAGREGQVRDPGSLRFGDSSGEGDTHVGIPDDEVGAALDQEPHAVRMNFRILVEVGCRRDDLADLRVGQRLEDRLHVAHRAPDVHGVATAVGVAHDELAAAAGVARLCTPTLQRLVDRGLVGILVGAGDRGAG